MVGCYGDHPEDRHYERMLDRYLAEGEEEEGVEGALVDEKVEPAYYPDPEEVYDDYY